jgi:hypothetical protein
VLVFVLQNRDDMSVHLLSIDVTSPLWLVLVHMPVVATRAGFVFGRGRG